MTDSEPVEDLLPRIQRQYTEQPRDWRVLHTPRGDMLVIGPDSAFQMKLVPINPMQFTGAGTEIPSSSRDIERIRESPEYGLRPLSLVDIEELVRSLSSQVDIRPKIDSIIRRDPVIPAELRDSEADLLLNGPVLTRPDFSALSPETLKLQMSLERDAMATFRRKYPLRSGMFI